MQLTNLSNLVKVSCISRVSFYILSVFLDCLATSRSVSFHLDPILTGPEWRETNAGRMHCKRHGWDQSHARIK